MRAANGLHRRNSSALSAASSATSADRSASSACLLICYQGIDKIGRSRVQRCNQFKCKQTTMKYEGRILCLMTASPCHLSCIHLAYHELESIVIINIIIIIILVSPCLHCCFTLTNLLILLEGMCQIHRTPRLHVLCTAEMAKFVFGKQLCPPCNSCCKTAGLLCGRNETACN